MRTKVAPRSVRTRLLYVRKNYSLYLLLIPALLYVYLFFLRPMYGLQLAFREYNMFAVPGDPWASIGASKFVGWKWFLRVFGRKDFMQVLRNTMEISLLKLAITFPIPILFAILLNEVRSDPAKRCIQTAVYLPHFLSWTVVAGVFVSLCGSTGMLNQLLGVFGMPAQKWLMDNMLFRVILLVSSTWKEMGWNSIIYLAAIAGLDQEVYEAADVDGANRFQQCLHVTLPGLMPTIVLMFIMRLGSLMDAGFAQIFVMYNPTVYESADIIGTYVYRLGLGKMDFSTGTAVGLFNSVISFILVIGSNFAAKKSTGKSIW